MPKLVPFGTVTVFSCPCSCFASASLVRLDLWHGCADDQPVADATDDRGPTLARSRNHHCPRDVPSESAHEACPTHPHLRYHLGSPPSLLRSTSPPTPSSPARRTDPRRPHAHPRSTTHSPTRDALSSHVPDCVRRSIVRATRDPRPKGTNEIGFARGVGPFH